MALDAVDVALERGPVHRDHGPVRLGQVDPHALPGRARHRHRRAGVHRRHRPDRRSRTTQLTKLRRDQIGFVFQAFNLVPTLTALENITLPLDIAGRKPDQAWLDTVIDTVGPARPARPPAQRAVRRPAAARRRGPGAGQPARRSSSPTSPPATSTPGPAPRCSASCGAASTSSARPIVMVTHDPGAASYADRVLFLADGRIVDEMGDPTAERVLERMKRFDVAQGAAGLSPMLRSHPAQPLRAQAASVPLRRSPIVLGVAFVAGTFIFTDTLEQHLQRSVQPDRRPTSWSPPDERRSTPSPGRRARRRSLPARRSCRRSQARRRCGAGRRARSSSTASSSSARTARCIGTPGRPALRRQLDPTTRTSARPLAWSRAGPPVGADEVAHRHADRREGRARAVGDRSGS